MKETALPPSGWMDVAWLSMDEEWVYKKFYFVTFFVKL
jgi:hypothetical protein